MSEGLNNGDRQGSDDSPASTTRSAATVLPDGSRRWLYPDRRSGPYARIRRGMAIVLMVVYAVIPWLSWRGLPLIRFDILGGRLYLCGAVLRFADAGWLVFLLIGMALLLFFVTALKGRIWCGYGCPQTVFVEWLIRPLEEWIEGPAHHRRIVDRGPWTWQKAARKLAKHAAFLLIAAVIANMFVAYFFPPAQVLLWMRSSPFANPAKFAVMATVLAVFYFDLAWFREQFCAFLCPYARFQSVMMDPWTPAVSYDAQRGEPRGRRATGACIDCGLCVRVCPTGIDIREGLQLECIQCNRCADACDGVMTTLKRPLGLIRPVSAAALEGETPRSAFRRPRIWLYGLALSAAFALLGYRLWGRTPLSMSFTRQPGTSYSRLADGRLTNNFTLRTVNEGTAAVDLTLRSLTPGVEVICGSCAQPLAGFASATHVVVLVVSAQEAKTLHEVVVRRAADERSFVLPLLLPGRVKD